MAVEIPDHDIIMKEAANNWIRVFGERPSHGSGFSGCKRFQYHWDKDVGKVSVAICICCYNEEVNYLLRSLRSIEENLAYAKSLGLHIETRVVIIQDGYPRMHETLKKYMVDWFGNGWRSKIELDQAGQHMTYIVSDVSSRNDFGIDAIFVTKTENRFKYNTHQWFCGAAGFVDITRPDFFFLQDIGSCPDPNVFYDVLSEMICDSKIGCATGRQLIMSKLEQGEYEEEAKSPFVSWFLRGAQTYEYEIRSLMFVGTSLFGWHEVIYGAFGSFRTSTWLGKPMKWYFEILNDPAPGLFEGICRLTEDRLATTAMVLQAEREQLAVTLPSCVFKTECEISIQALAAQRRRWINGSWAISLLPLFCCFSLITKSKLSIWRKIMAAVIFPIRFLDYLMPLVVLPIYFEYIYVASLSVFGDDKTIPLFIWMCCILLNVVFVVTHIYKVFERTLWTILFYGGFFPHFLFVYSIYIQKDVWYILFPSNWLIYTPAYVAGIPLVFAILFYKRSFIQMSKTALRYFLFDHILSVWMSQYSLARLHDMTWGNRATGRTLKHDVSSQTMVYILLNAAVSITMMVIFKMYGPFTAFYILVFGWSIKLLMLALTGLYYLQLLMKQKIPDVHDFQNKKLK